jgi:hypothetical protein
MSPRILGYILFEDAGIKVKKGIIVAPWGYGPLWRSGLRVMA